MTGTTTPPGPDEIAALAERALAGIPERLRRHVRNLAIAVEDFADQETLDDLGIESEWDLSGLYRGVPLGQQSVLDVARGPEMIVLYRQPILLEWIETDEDLFRLVRNVVIHEVAHHFGFSDDEIAALERGDGG
jgi:acetylglutamate kinase